MTSAFPGLEPPVCKQTAELPGTYSGMDIQRSGKQIAEIRRECRKLDTVSHPSNA